MLLIPLSVDKEADKTVEEAPEDRRRAPGPVPGSKLQTGMVMTCCCGCDCFTSFPSVAIATVDWELKKGCEKEIILIWNMQINDKFHLRMLFCLF